MHTADFSSEIKTFIRENIEKNPSELMLGSQMPSDWPKAQIANQIKSRQKSRKKLPEWYANDELIFPPPLSVEQCSSEGLARFKAGMGQGKLLIDLTGGFGVDTAYMSSYFDEVIYVEQNKALCDLARHNFEVLGLKHVKIVHGDAAWFLDEFQHKADLIYADPSRRGNKGERLHSLREGKPDLISLLPILKEKSKNLLFKAAPMVDIRESLQLLPEFNEVLILERLGEVREVLFHYPGSQKLHIQVHRFLTEGMVESYDFDPDMESALPIEFSDIRRYVYDPSAGIRKSGMFRQIAEYFGIAKISANTHLYISDQLIESFPGRIFEVQEVIRPSDARKRFRRANVITRNYPEKAEKLKQAYRIKDGGDNYLIFMSDMSGLNKCLNCSRLQ
jgi:hypothetical protein